MRRTFQLALPNGLFGDPLVVARLRLLPRTVLLDAGDMGALPPRALLGASDVLVSHAHVDHVFGLGRLLRVRFGRAERPLRVFGPPGLTARVRAHLDGYTWNLVPAYPLDLRVVEVDVPGGSVTVWRFPPDRGFEPFVEERRDVGAGGLVFEDELLVIAALALEHGTITSLAWRVAERYALNVDPVALERRGLPTGPWLARLKDAVRRGLPDDHPLEVPGRGPTTVGAARREILRESPGDSVVYATDAAPTARTVEALAAFARGARRLLVETHFRAAARELAARHGHLTTELAGAIARAAGVAAVSPLHASTRHQEEADALLAEFRASAAPVPVELLATVAGEDAA